MRASVVALAGVAAAIGAVPVPAGIAADSALDQALSPVSTCPVSAYQATAGLVDCFGEHLGNVFVDQAVSMLARQGREVFGENFRLVPALSWAPGGNGLAGDIDMVVPLANRDAGRAVGGPERMPRHAVFLQQGLTRWMDARGLRRNDMRTGVGYRTALPHDPVATLGASMVIQKSLEAGHQRLVIGADYAGGWGQVSFRQFLPTTGWRRDIWNVARVEERAIGGTDVRVQLTLTSTLAVEAASGRWERHDGARQSVDSRWSLDWRPHPWLRVAVGYRGGTEIGADGESVMLLMRFPLGASPTRPRWNGPGRFGATATLPDMWRPVDNIGAIRTVRRVTAEDARELPIGPPQAEARFLQSSAETGGAIDVEVRLSEPVRETIELIVRLVPGPGSNPAVPGADYVDGPARVTIDAGQTAARVSFRLMDNPDLAAARTLAVTVSPAN